MKYYDIQIGCMGYIEGRGYMLFASDSDYREHISEEEQEDV